MWFFTIWHIKALFARKSYNFHLYKLNGRLDAWILEITQKLDWLLWAVRYLFKMDNMQEGSLRASKSSEISGPYIS